MTDGIRLRCIAHQLAAHPRSAEIFTTALNKPGWGVVETLQSQVETKDAGMQQLLGHLYKDGDNMYLSDAITYLSDIYRDVEVSLYVPGADDMRAVIAANPGLDILTLLNLNELPYEFCVQFLQLYYLPQVAKARGWKYVMNTFPPTSVPSSSMSPVQYITALLHGMAIGIMNEWFIHHDKPPHYRGPTLGQLRVLTKLNTDADLLMWLRQFCADLLASTHLPLYHDIQPSEQELYVAQIHRNVALLALFNGGMAAGLVKAIPATEWYNSDLTIYENSPITLRLPEMTSEVQAVLEQIYLDTLGEGGYKFKDVVTAWLVQIGGFDIPACVARTLDALGGGVVVDRRLKGLLGTFVV